MVENKNVKKKCWATKTCFTTFKKKNCGHCKNCTVPVVKCLTGHKCAKECVWLSFANCYFRRLPPTLVTTCSRLFVSHKFKKCVSGCIHIIKTKRCWDKCVKLRIDEEHSKCHRVLVKKGESFQRCSIKAIGLICHKQCKHSPAICKNVCKEKKNVDIVIVIVVVLNVLEVLINVVNGVLKKNIKNVLLFQFLQNIVINVGIISLTVSLINVLENVFTLNLSLHGKKKL